MQYDWILASWHRTLFPAPFLTTTPVFARRIIFQILSDNGFALLPRPPDLQQPSPTCSKAA